MSKLKTLVKLIKENPKSIFIVLAKYNLFNFIPDKPYLKILYRLEMGEKLNLENPKGYNEKLQWIKLYDRKNEYKTYVDKYEVRRYVEGKVGRKYLIPILGKYESTKEIDWDNLPNEFVLKCTHGSGSNVICTDKTKLNFKMYEKKINKWMKRNWYYFGREWPYKELHPSIICEKFIGNKSKVPEDYKIMCFGGEPKLIQVHRGRYSEYTQDFYDIYWNKMDFNNVGYKGSKYEHEKPKQLEEMLDIARKLSEGLRQIRIDLYCVNEQIYFGEMTFFDASGLAKFEPHEYEDIIGSWIKI
ncbi:MAG: ATP-grasp fold amidoligase family protein [Paraclostridium sordellii]